MLKVISESTVGRLRESHRQGEENAARKGYDAGWQWAAQHAEVVELERLVAYARSEPDYTDDRSDAFGPAHRVLEAIQGNEADRTDSEDFWQDVLGLAYPAGAILAGFVEGVTDFWDRAQELMANS
jgi:hypothetical protein